MRKPSFWRASNSRGDRRSNGGVSNTRLAGYGAACDLLISLGLFTLAQLSEVKAGEEQIAKPHLLSDLLAEQRAPATCYRRPRVHSAAGLLSAKCDSRSGRLETVSNRG
jgi:hypothetical protein